MEGESGRRVREWEWELVGEEERGGKEIEKRCFYGERYLEILRVPVSERERKGGTRVQGTGAGAGAAVCADGQVGGTALCTLSLPTRTAGVPCAEIYP